MVLGGPVEKGNTARGEIYFPRGLFVFVVEGAAARRQVDARDSVCPADTWPRPSHTVP